MPNLKFPEIMLILLVVLILFGAKRLPDLAKGVGQSLRILKHEVSDHDDDRPANAAANTPPAAASTPPVAAPSPTYTDPVTRAPSVDGTERKQV